jgi:hypothetical protein
MSLAIALAATPTIALATTTTTVATTTVATTAVATTGDSAGAGHLDGHLPATRSTPHAAHPGVSANRGPGLRERGGRRVAVQLL